MITEDQKESVVTHTGSLEQGPISSGPVTSEKPCPSPSSSSSSPSAVKSSTESGTGSSSGDEAEGNVVIPRQNGLISHESSVLTPPTDVDAPNSGLEEPVRYNGRLEFYKEGILCLELSNVEEGDGRKWLKTKGKSDKRQVVKVSKEVTIPRSSTPSNFILSHPPNGISFNNENISDEEFSASSSASPKSREKSWRKQPVPQKFISTSLNFFMKPSPCVHTIPLLQQPKVHLRVLTPRRPYVLHNLNNLDKIQVNPASDSEREHCKCGEPKRRKVRKNATKEKEASYFEKILLKLYMSSERSAATQKAKSARSTPPQKITRQYPVPGASSRKRPSKDIEGSDSDSSVKPRKSPTKMILSVPGITSSPSTGKRHAQTHHSGTKSRSLLQGCDTTDGKGRHDRNAKKNNNAGTTRKSPPYSLLRSTPEIGPMAPCRENANVSDDSGQDTEETLSPEEQEQIQQHAMNKAISYTITSLLGGVVPPTALGKKLKNCSSNANQSYSNAKLLSNTTAAVAIQHAGLFGNEQDKNSFLRHLLDTSDPIPTSHASPTSIPPKAHQSTTDLTPKLKSKSKRLTKVSPYGETGESKIQKSRNNFKTSPIKDGKLMNHGTIFGTRTSPTTTGGNPVQQLSYQPFSVTPSTQLESLAAMHYASQIHSHFISPPTVTRHPYNNASHPLTQSQPVEAEDDAPINLSQKDGEWPTAKLPNDRASKIQSEGRAFSNVPHHGIGNSEESDPDLPLNLCKKRRDD